jgi:predicted RNA methylase
LSYRTIYTPAFKRLLQGVQARARKEILKPIYPNAIKVGLTILGGGLVLRASTIVGSLYLSLDDIASYGITIQIIMIISSIASVYFTTYQPKIVQYRVQNDNLAIKQLYLRGCLLLFCTFLLGGAVLVFLGEWAMNVIGSQTPLLSKSFILAALLIYLLETNHANAGGILLTKNEVPYFKASLFSGAFTVILLFVFLMYTDFGVWGLLLAQGIAQGCYQNWKWPLEVVKELCVKRKDMYSIPLKTTTFNFALFQWKKRKKDQEAQRLNDLRKDIINYLQTVPPAGMTDEYQAVLDYLTHHPLSVFPYSYTGKYNPEDIVVYLDAEKKMRYILQDGKRLYFRKGWDEKQVQAYYNGLLIEQDSCSPHCYETAGFHVSEGDVVVDAGAAEGNFALSVIDKVKKIYLFEVDKKWIAALKATFAPWKEKVTIVNKYVSDNDKKNCITLDTFFGNEQIDFIKADIEGAECQLLAGAKKILSGQTPMNVVLCTYHKHDDAEVLNEMLVEKGFRTEISKGYMIFLYETYDKLKPPYLRRGLLRGIRMGKQVKE